MQVWMGGFDLPRGQLMDQVDAVGAAHVVGREGPLELPRFILERREQAARAAYTYFAHALAPYLSLPSVGTVRWVRY